MTTNMQRRLVLVDGTVHQNEKVSDIVVDEVTDYGWFNPKKLGFSDRYTPFRLIDFTTSDMEAGIYSTYPLNRWLLEAMTIIPSSELRPLRCDNGTTCECGGQNIAGDADIQVIYVLDKLHYHHEMVLCRWGRQDLNFAEMDGHIHIFYTSDDMFEWESEDVYPDEQLKADTES